MITSNMIDRLADLDAQLADLKGEREAIAAAIKADAQGAFAEYEGTEHCVTVFSTIRTVIDWKAVAAKLEPSRQLVVAHSKDSNVCTLKVVGKAKLAA
jgi:hypothetical protein